MTILKSICSKAACKEDGKQPNMILPACSTRKWKLSESDIDLSEDEESSDDEFDFIVELDDDEEFDEYDDDDADSDALADQLLKTWKGVKPPNKEENLLRKRSAVNYSGKHQQDQVQVKVNKLLIICLS